MSRLAPAGTEATYGRRSSPKYNSSRPSAAGLGRCQDELGVALQVVNAEDPGGADLVEGDEPGAGRPRQQFVISFWGGQRLNLRRLEIEPRETPRGRRVSRYDDQRSGVRQ